MALTQFQFILVVLGIIFICGLVGVCFFYISRKYPKAVKKADPLVKALLIMAIIWIIYLSAAALGFIKQEDFKAHIKWFVLAALALIIFYAMVSYYKNRMIASHVLWQNYVLPKVKLFWNAEPYCGYAYGTPFLFHRVVENSSNKMLKDKTNASVVDIFLGTAKFASIFIFLAIMDKRTGEDIEFMRNPPLNIIQGLLGKEAVSSYRKAIDDYQIQEQNDVTNENEST